MTTVAIWILVATSLRTTFVFDKFADERSCNAAATELFRRSQAADTYTVRGVCVPATVLR
jgi:hypothetical protein